MTVEESCFRSDESGRKIIVAIDGPSGAGKSTIARRLARHFGLLNLETGAMYRAFALKALRAGLPLDENAGLERLAAETTIHLEPGDEDNRVLLDGEDVSGLLRNRIVTDGASAIYGSDAVGGVVNIILRSKFDGAESRVLFGAVGVISGVTLECASVRWGAKSCGRECRATLINRGNCNQVRYPASCCNSLRTDYESAALTVEL